MLVSVEAGGSGVLEVVFGGLLPIIESTARRPASERVVPREVARAPERMQCHPFAPICLVLPAHHLEREQVIVRIDGGDRIQISPDAPAHRSSLCIICLSGRERPDRSEARESDKT